MYLTIVFNQAKKKKINQTKKNSIPGVLLLYYEIINLIYSLKNIHKFHLLASSEYLNRYKELLPLKK